MATDTIHLAADGCDAGGDGSRRRPLATLAKVVAVARERGAAARRRIVVGDGFYPDTHAALTAADSGLEIVAAPGAAPVLCGGVRIGGWQPEGGGSPFWVAALPGVQEGTWDFRALVVNGRFAPRARFPADGAIRHASEFPVRWMSSTKGGWERKPTEAELTTLQLVPDRLPAALAARNAELTVYHCWDESLVGIRAWDRAAGVITFSTPAGHPPGAFGDWKEQARTFVVWNVREGMTRPGQWYLDREGGRLVYWPLPEERLEEIAAFAPTRTSVLRLEGTEAAPVRDVRLRGLTVALTTTPLLAGGFGALRFAGAIEGEHAHGLRLERVTVRWAGGQGVRVLRSNGVRCVNATVHDVGAGGVVLAGSDGVIAGTLIHHNGRTYPSALALRVSGERWRVHHNTLHHTPYSAINAGGRDLRFEHNRFHHVMEVLLDGAAIYVFAGKSCVLRGNYTDAVRDEQVHAYYLDEQCEHSRVEGNVAVGVPWPLHNHMAWDCVLRDNVCLHDTGSLRVSFPNCAGFRLERNVFACAGELAFEPSCTGVARLTRNVFHSRAGLYRWAFHDRLPSLERSADPVPALPANAGSVLGDVGARCEDGRITYANRALAARLGLRELDVSGAGCGRE
jgi:PAS domain-containing protein